MTVLIFDEQRRMASLGINLILQSCIKCQLLWLICERQWCRQKWYHTWAARPLILPLTSIIKLHVTYGLSWAVQAAAKSSPKGIFTHDQLDSEVKKPKQSNFFKTSMGLSLKLHVIWWIMCILVVWVFDGTISDSICGRTIYCFWHTAKLWQRYFWVKHS